MSELHKFLFEGLPVRGMLVRLDDSWRDVLKRRETQGAFPAPVRHLLGEMAAAAVLMQSNIKFKGSLILQAMGDGPVKLAVAEVGSDLKFRCTAKVVGEVQETATLPAMLNAHGHGRCAITLDPQDRLPGQQPYQGVVPLSDANGEPLQQVSKVIEQYMRQSEQLDTCLVLAANDELAAGLLIQRLPLEGKGNLEGQGKAGEKSAEELADAFNRISMLASTLTREELLTLDADTVLRRLFWEEDMRRFEPLVPSFACSCSRERVGGMLQGLGRAEVDEALEQMGQLEIDCDFCGARYHFDAVDVGALFATGTAKEADKGTLQ
ncbi:MAG: Hsp33 family molecular chaperone HslO [Burkholderiaceae bacterium]|nr:Hsp33 family molecular chaperone HslO [Roseateles sp.]MBV8470141.1 Hsp33 family molecular chaperone HslO [Burkholderiaceae bacterium]